MSNDTAVTQTTNIVPVQGIFMPEPTFALISLIGPAGTPFYAAINPLQSNLTITNSTINSTVIGGTTPSSATFTNIATTTGTISTGPTNAADIANKQYVDQIAAGLSVKAPVIVATTVDITLSGLQLIDGVTVAAGNRVLVKNQTAQAENGIYVAASGAWSRATDMATWAQVPGAFCFVQEGSTQADNGYVCTSNKGGTINVTPITWVQFNGITNYTAGTGLSLVGNTFSITNTGVTAGAYGSGSSVPTYSVNAQGQLTLAANVSISIAASQITSGTIASSLISGNYTGITGLGTLLDLTVTNTINGSINGNAATATNATSSATSTNLSGGSTGAIPYQTAAGATTFLASGTGVLVGGSAPSYTTSPSLVGTNFTGTASGLSIGGNAATATTATNIAGGTVNAIPYQNAAGSSVFLAAGTVGYILQTNSTSSPPAWVAPSGLTVGFATNISGGVAGAVPYQSAVGTTGFSAAGTASQVLLSGGTGSPTWTNQNTLSVGYSDNINGGAAGSLPYQTGSNTTGFIATSTNGYVLTLTAGLPGWAALPATGVTIVDDTTTNATRYLTFTDATSGNITTENVSSTRLQFNPSTGALTSTSLTPTNPLAVAYGGTGVTSSTGTNKVVLSTAPTFDTYTNFTSITAPSYAEGRVWYDSTEKALAFYNDSSALAVHVGQDLIVKVINNTGSTIPNGSPVYVTGTSSGQTYPNIALARADVAATCAVIGLTNGAIANGAFGYVTAQGIIDNVNTGTFTVGQVLYLSPYSAGQLMNTIPPTGITVQVGVVTFVNSSTGHIYVKQTTPLNVPASIISGVLATANGGTGLSSYATGDIIYASATNTLSKLAAGTNGYVLTLAGGVPSWAAASGGLSITDDTTTNSSLYPLFTTATSGAVTTQYVSSTKYTYNPSLGTLSAPQVNASNGLIVNSLTVAASYSIPSGSSAMSVGPVTVASGQSVTVPSGSKWVVL